VPTYVYSCVNCGKKIEISCHHYELEEIEKNLACDACGGAVKRKLAPFVTHFNYTRRK
jgi:predicted nucleic acid-binding Zn ribbon protein